MATIAIIFFILGFVHGYVILWLNGYISKKHLMVPNLWCWHSAWGILWVVLVNYWLIWPGSPFTPEVVLKSLSVTFLAAFPGVYIANHIQWLKQNKKKVAMPGMLLLETLMKNGRKRTD